MRLQYFVQESINDKSLLKSVFFIGYPGSGKTTISRLVSDGALPIMSISSDIWTEWLNNTKGKSDWGEIGDKVKSHTISGIVNNTNGLLPIFVDTTGANIKNFQNRVQILRNVGYDVSMVIVSVTPETSIERVDKRNKTIKRQVPEEFLMKAHKAISAALPKFKQIIPDNITVDNNVLTDDDILKAYKSVTKFFNQPIQNEKGKILVDYMRKNGYKYYMETPKEWREKNGYPDLSRNSLKWFKKL